MLTGGSVAICGASAAMAISCVLPQNEDNQRDTLFTVVAVTSLSTFVKLLRVAMLVPVVVTDSATNLSSFLLVTAIAALGVHTSMQAMLEIGWRRMILVLAETIFTAVSVFGFHPFLHLMALYFF